MIRIVLVFLQIFAQDVLPTVAPDDPQNVAQADLLNVAPVAPQVEARGALNVAQSEAESVAVRAPESSSRVS